MEIQSVPADPGAGDDEDRARVSIHEKAGQEQGSAGDHQHRGSAEGRAPADHGGDVVLDDM